MKKSMVLLPLLLILVCLTAVSASPVMRFSAGSVTCAAGDTVTIPVTLTDNAGFVSANLTLTYDSSVLTLVSVEDSGTLEGAVHSDSLTSPYRLAWNNDLSSADGTAEGEAARLTFAVSSDAAPGEYPLHLSVPKYGILNASGRPVDCGFADGVIRVGLPGDGSGDGIVDSADALLLRKYLAGWNVTINETNADVNGDGKINAMDSVILRQFLDGWDGTAEK